MAGKSWGIHSSMLKFWYKTIIEKILTYGAGIWGGNLTKQAIQKLSSVQRKFLLQISRGYRTTSTDALNVITGIPPIHLTLQYEYRRGRILLLKDQTVRDTLFPNTHIQHKSNSWQLHGSREVSHYIVNPERNSHKYIDAQAAYTDGSKTKSGVAAAFCITKGRSVEHRWSCRLTNNNSVFQAELYAVLRALDWIEENSAGLVHIFSDSLSGLQAIHKHRTKNPLILQIKQKLLNLTQKVRLGHVSAHIGIFGNEMADSLAKAATEKQEVDINLPAPHSYIKRKLKLALISQWQDHWDYSEKGRYTYALIPKVNSNFLSTKKHQTAFLTGHGPFGSYLHRFQLKRTASCDCGADTASPDHYYYRCPLTEIWHLKRPTQLKPPQKWLEDILTRPALNTKLLKIYQFLLDINN